MKSQRPNVGPFLNSRIRGSRGKNKQCQNTDLPVNLAKDSKERYIGSTLLDDQNTMNAYNGEGEIDVLKRIRIKNINRLIIATLNINSLANKFEQLKVIVGNNIDVLVIIETKLDKSFPKSQFLIEGFSQPFRLDRNRHGGGIMVYVREDIPSKELDKHNFKKNVEGMFIEINLRKMKLLLFATYHSTHPEYGMNDRDYLEEIGLALDVYSNYDKFLLTGDFNMEEEETCISDFLFEYNAKNLVKDKTCFKNIDNPSCIDLFITNCSKSFQNTTTVSSGLSDFHKMILTVMKTTIPKSKPKTIFYRDYKKFVEEDFRHDLKTQLKTAEIENYYTFHKIFLDVFEKHAPCKKKIVRANHKPYMTKIARKAIMRRSMLENRYYKMKTAKSKSMFRKQRNYTNKLIKREKRKYFKNLDTKNFTDNRKFWTTVQPLFSENGGGSEKITLVKDEKIISDDREVAETFNQFFKESVQSLNINENRLLQTDTGDLNDPVEIALKKFSNHPSIKDIKEMVDKRSSFSFSKVNARDIETEIKALKTNKACTFLGIPAKILKQVIDTIKIPLMQIWNIEVIENKKFPTKLKYADIKPIFKKLERFLVENYRPVSILPVVSKMFERLMQKQINKYVESYLSPYLCGYRKGYNAQYALTLMIEKWKQSLDSKGHAGAILMDLSKAFDTLNHELLVAKLGAYGFEKSALVIILDYLSDRWQRTKINVSFSSWSELLTGVPQGSVLGPLLFNLYINDFFCQITKTHACNFADDASLNAFSRDLEELLSSLEYDTLSAIIWFENNFMRLNEEKCHFLVAANTNEHLWVKVGDAMIWESQNEKLLGLTIDKNLKFNIHLANICKKASQKVSALSRVAKILPLHRKRELLKAFIESQFSYCPLIWMFCSRKMNRKINHIHERALRLVYDDYISSFKELLRRDNTVSIHHRNVQLVAIEMYKIVHSLSPPFMREIFSEKGVSSTRSQGTFIRPRVNTVYKGENSFRSFGPVVWDQMIPTEFKSYTSLSKFKKAIKTWTPENCTCRLCKPYIAQLGFTSVSM